VSTAPVPIAEGLFTGPSESPRLIASRCRDCAEVAFPAQAGCPNCTGQSTEEIRLSPRGTLWTWTIQRFPPPPPYIGDRDDFTPYGVGYIELPEGVRVEARLTINDPEKLAIGMEMELVLEEFDAAGEEAARMTFAFAPVAG
jgi:uncharacterized OB-fold protein